MKQIFLLIIFFLSCLNAQDNPYKSVSEIPLPKGYKRIELPKKSFGLFLRNFKLKKNSMVYLYNGKKKRRQDVQFAVLDIDRGNRDLQQCADAVMRLRAEYLYTNKMWNNIHFQFTNGDTAYYTKYAEGYRLKVRGNKTYWIKKAKKDYTYKTFRSYMDVVFSYAGTYSLNQEVTRISKLNNMEIGDIFLQTGNPYGHAVIVMDMAKNTKGDTIFLLAQSYMPAQDIHILRNPSSSLSPWYKLSFKKQLITPEWTFQKHDLKRFP